MRLMIFYPGGTSHAVILPDDASNEEIYDIMYKAATIKEGNGNAKNHTNKEVDDRFSK